MHQLYCKELMQIYQVQENHTLNTILSVCNDLVLRSPKVFFLNCGREDV